MHSPSSVFHRASVAALSTLLLVSSPIASAASEPPPQAAVSEPPSAQARAPEVEPTPPPPFELHPRHGRVDLGSGLATLNVPEHFDYISPEETDDVLVKAWGNPPNSEKTLGMLLPAGVPLARDDAWGVIITYLDDGHVSDDDATKIDYAELLRNMQSGVAEENAERRKAGYEPIRLIGWGAPPHYDRATRKLYWAKELKFGESSANTLNYNIRVLGKEGVLVLNAVAGMTQLAQVERDMRDVMTFVDFTDEHRYERFDPRTGRAAAYGIAGLVAGGALMKGGFFKTLIAMALAGKKLIVVAIAAIGGAIAKWRKKDAP